MLMTHVQGHCLVTYKQVNPTRTKQKDWLQKFTNNILELFHEHHFALTLLSFLKCTWLFRVEREDVVLSIPVFCLKTFNTKETKYITQNILKWNHNVQAT